jgi:hypothetical protein
MSALAPRLRSPSSIPLGDGVPRLRQSQSQSASVRTRTSARGTFRATSLRITINSVSHGAPDWACYSGSSARISVTSISLDELVRNVKARDSVTSWRDMISSTKQRCSCVYANLANMQTPTRLSFDIDHALPKSRPDASTPKSGVDSSTVRLAAL